MYGSSIYVYTNETGRRNLSGFIVFCALYMVEFLPKHGFSVSHYIKYLKRRFEPLFVSCSKPRTSKKATLDFSVARMPLLVDDNRPETVLSVAIGVGDSLRQLHV
jgi:hypothetical protein